MFYFILHNFNFKPTYWRKITRKKLSDKEKKLKHRKKKERVPVKSITAVVRREVMTKNFQRILDETPPEIPGSSCEFANLRKKLKNAISLSNK